MILATLFSKLVSGLSKDETGHQLLSAGAGR